jgi:hypothetical protein
MKPIRFKWRVRRTYNDGQSWTFLKRDDGKTHVRFATLREADEAAERWRLSSRKLKNVSYSVTGN